MSDGHQVPDPLGQQSTASVPPPLPVPPSIEEMGGVGGAAQDTQPSAVTHLSAASDDAVASSFPSARATDHGYVIPPPPGQGSRAAERPKGKGLLGYLSLGFAVIALVLSIAGPVAFLALPVAVLALVFGARALKRRMPPHGIAMAGVIGSAVSIVGSVLVTVAFWSGLSNDVTITHFDDLSLESDSSADSHASALVDGQIGDGEWTVGTDVAAGIYRTVAPIDWDTMGLCLWETYGDQTEESWIGSDLAYAGNPMVELEDGQRFVSDGCGVWAAVDEASLAGATAETFSDGYWMAGADIVPGVYRPSEALPVGDDGAACVADVSLGLGLEYENNVTWVTSYGGYPTIVLDQGAVVNTSDCGEWVLVDPATLGDEAAPAQSAGEGYWLVGEDIAPGTYSLAQDFAPAEEFDACYYSVYSTYGTASWEEYVDSGFIEEGNASVVLEMGYEFSSTGCGEWVKE